MNNPLPLVFSLMLRVVWVMSGLVLLASLLFAAAVAGLVWGMRSVWGRLTGKPVTPFIFTSFSQGRSTQWESFKSASDIWSAKAKEPQNQIVQRAKSHEVANEVTDVESRPSRSSESNR